MNPVTLFSSLFAIFAVTTARQPSEIRLAQLKLRETFGTLITLDTQAALSNATPDDKLTLEIGDQVTIAEIDDVNDGITVILYEVTNNNETETIDQINSEIRTTKRTYGGHYHHNFTRFFCNEHLRRKSVHYGSAPREDENEHIRGDLKIVVKFGAREAYQALGNVASGVCIAMLNTKIHEIMYGVDGGKNCMSDIRIFQIGSTWLNAAGLSSILTCRTGGKKCDTTLAREKLEKAVRWADNSMDDYPNSEYWTYGFSNSGTWHFCIKVTRKEMQPSRAGADVFIRSLECPKGFCGKGKYDDFSHDEL
ncbi:hypothetical protein G9P44_000730 [Scheffersomyces stipitis]|nr:hypothetical protein G9P44_000730 [Scheffersomyces stipitis]